MDRKGFSLIEVLIAVLILSLVATGLAYLFLAGKRYTKHNQLKSQAMEVARYYLASLQMQVRQDQWGTNCLGTGSGCPDTPAYDMAIGAITYQPNSTVTPNYLGTAISKVKLTISWNETAP